MDIPGEFNVLKNRSGNQERDQRESQRRTPLALLALKREEGGRGLSRQPLEARGRVSASPSGPPRRESAFLRACETLLGHLIYQNLSSKFV